MPITNTNTVLILGAGASVPFGLPVGASLIDDISKNLDKQLETFRNINGTYFSIGPLFPLTDIKVFSRFPYLQPLFWKIDAVDAQSKLTIDNSELNKIFREEVLQMDELKNLLRNQTSDSIDDFIIMNPSHAERVKICIAAEFILKLYRPPTGSLRGLELRNLEARYLSMTGKSSNESVSERNWIHRLINVIRLGISNKVVTIDNKVQIVSFNYDSILEHVLDQQFANTENGPAVYPNYRDFIEIFHVHGKMGELANSLNVPARVCWDWASGIKVIRENDGEFTASQSSARQVVYDASEIYCCGFAFAKANTDLLGLREHSPNVLPRQIHYCNFSNDIGLRNAAKKFAHSKRDGRQVITGVFPQDNIGVADWIGNGTLGELP